MTDVTKPASDQSFCAVCVLLKFGTVQKGLGVGVGEAVGGGLGVGVGTAVGPGVGVGDGDGDGDGLAVGVAVGIGIAVWTGMPLMTPARIGNADEAETSRPFPRTKLRIGVIRWNRQVTTTL